MSGAYDDIINLPHPTSARHPRMSLADRAAIFSPFAALVGHGAAIEETARLTDQKIELTEEEKKIYKRGRNAKSYTTAKNASVIEYRKATGFEALCGYLYLTGQQERMLALMKKAVALAGMKI